MCSRKYPRYDPLKLLQASRSGFSQYLQCIDPPNKKHKGDSHEGTEQALCLAIGSWRGTGAGAWRVG
ncbi:protein of unknown function [Pseudomonas sp. JV551A1]|nr:protein of unknown function [Pseudomonas sp. JV551A1]